MTDYYIDSRATGANDGDPGGVTGPDGSGIYQDAWQSIAAAETAKPYVAGDTISFVVGSGPYRESFNMGKNGGSGNPILWKTTTTGQKVEISAGDDMNDSAYQWTASAGGTNEYYLELNGGGDPSLAEVKSATVDGYYRGSSAEAARQRQSAGSLDNLSFGWGDNDTLGYSTLYVRVDSGAPSTVVVIASQRDEITDINWGHHDFEDLIYSYGNVKNINPRGINWTYRRCAFLYPDFRGVGSTGGGTTVARFISCLFFWPGHSAIAIQGSSAASVEAYNCTDYNAHLFGLLDTSTTGAIIATNNISLSGEAGAIDKKAAGTTLTESNNLWYPRMTAAGGDLGYVSPANWATTANSDIPPGTATNKNALAVTTGRDEYPNLKDPLLVGVRENAFESSNFRLHSDSPAAGAGIDWWTAISESLPLDYLGNTYDADNIHLGAFQALSGPSTATGIMQPIMASGY